MNTTINYAIDLGTTNSVIAKCLAGEVEIFKNPVGLKEVLPSVVAFKKGRVLVGDKAAEMWEKSPNNVVGLFKRKMGTNESYFIQSTSEFLSPIQLSAYVLKELKNFIYNDDILNDIVITIPASFDTVQSNATKEAGKEAGFKEVLLLQEPVAASLAFVNKSGFNLEQEGVWVVYDLGGGTFDVALISIQDGEMQVIDHVGDNFMGGTDFDALIIEKIILPKLQEKGVFEDIENQFKSSKGKHNKLYYELLYKAEQTKIQLSSSMVVEFEFDIEDDNGGIIEFYEDISVEEFNTVIEDTVTKSIDLIHELLNQNQLLPEQINSILMIGGSTYIPLVRRKIEIETKITPNYSVDPTTAVATGAAYYAGTKSLITKKSRNSEEEGNDSNTSKPAVLVRAGYQKHTQELEEYFTAKVDGNIDGLKYRITRIDGGFDTGSTELLEVIEQDLPLLKGAENSFNFNIIDRSGNKVLSNFTSFTITQGMFGILGQTLPADICIEIDDLEEKETALDVIFEKNSLLPIKKRLTKEVGRTLKKDSSDHILINILEGKQHVSPASNKPIGVIKITGKDIERDLLKGTDVEITVELSESRELKVYTYLSMTGQEFENLFSASERYVDIVKLKTEIETLAENVRMELNSAQNEENFEKAAELKKLESKIQEMYIKSTNLVKDDTTDTKYQLEDLKRKYAHKIDEMSSDEKIIHDFSNLESWFSHAESLINVHGNENEKVEFIEFQEKVRAAKASGNRLKMRNITDQLISFTSELRWRVPEQVKRIFYSYAFESLDMYSDQKEAEKFIKKGEKAIDNDRIDELKAIINKLSDNYRGDISDKSFDNRTGLV
jgi:molecular chaperone DnaK